MYLSGQKIVHLVNTSSHTTISTYENSVFFGFDFVFFHLRNMQSIFFRFPPVIHLRNMFAHVFSASPPTKHTKHALRIFFRFPGNRPDPPTET